MRHSLVFRSKSLTLFHQYIQRWKRDYSTVYHVFCFTVLTRNIIIRSKWKRGKSRAAQNTGKPSWVLWLCIPLRSCFVLLPIFIVWPILCLFVPVGCYNRIRIQTTQRLKPPNDKRGSKSLLFHSLHSVCAFFSTIRTWTQIFLFLSLCTFLHRHA